MPGAAATANVTLIVRLTAARAGPNKLLELAAADDNGGLDEDGEIQAQAAPLDVIEIEGELGMQLRADVLCLRVGPWGALSGLGGGVQQLPRAGEAGPDA